MNKTRFVVAATFLIICAGFAFSINAQKKQPPKNRLGKICGNPQKPCHTIHDYFRSYEIPFEIPSDNNVVIVESEAFYIVILKTFKPNPDVDCENAISETERLEIQSLFPQNKVFALKCADAGNLYYMNVATDVNFIAVYAGKTLSEAKKFLETVKATGKFKGANIRRTQTGFNGT